MDFRGVKRKELQALCKKNGIPANLSNLDMAQRLTSLFKEKEKPVTRGRSCLKNSSLVETGSREAKKVSFSPVNETFEFVASETDNVKTNPRAARRRSMSKPPENGGNGIEPLIREPNSVSVEQIGRAEKRQLRNREVGAVEVENRGTKKNVVQEDHRKRYSVRRSCEDKTSATEAASFAPGNVRRRSKRNLEKAGSSPGVDFRSEFKRDTEPPPSPGLDLNAVHPLKCLISEGVSKIDEGVEEHMELPPPKGRQRGSKRNDTIATNKSVIASTSEERVADEAVRINVPSKQRREARRRKETNVTDDIKKETQKKNRNLACKSSVSENEPVPEEPPRRSSRIAPTLDPVVPAGMCVNASRRREQQTKPKSVMMERGSEIKESETASANIPVLSPMKKAYEKKMKGKKGSRSKSHAKEELHSTGEFDPMTTELEKGKDVVTETAVAAAPDQHSNSSAKQQHSLEAVNPVITELEEGKVAVTEIIAANSSDQQLQNPLRESLVSTELENMLVESDRADQSDDEVKSQLKESETARSSNNPVLSLMKKASGKKMKGKKGSRISKSHAKEQHSPDEFNPMTTELEKGKDVVTATVVSAVPDQHSNSSAKQQHSLEEFNPVITELEEGKVVVTEIIAATSSDQQLQNQFRESLLSTEVENMLVESDHFDQGDDGCLSHQKGDLDHSDEVKPQSLDYQDQPSGALVSHNTTSAKGCSPIHNLDHEDGGSYVVALDRWNGKENIEPPIGGCFEVTHAAEGEITYVPKEQNIVEYEEQTVGEPDLFVTAVESFDCKSSESKRYKHNFESDLENIKVSGEFNVCDGKEDNLRTLKERENNEDESSLTRMTASEIVLHEVTEKNQLCKALDGSDEMIRSGYSFIASQKGAHKKYGWTSHTIDVNIPTCGTPSRGQDLDDYQLRNLVRTTVNSRDIIEKEGNSNLTTRMVDGAVGEGGTLLSYGFEGFNQKISQEAGETKQSDEEGIAHSPSASPRISSNFNQKGQRRNLYVGVSEADGYFSPNLAGFFLDKGLSGDDEVSKSRVLTSSKATEDGNEGNEASWSQHRRGYHKDMTVTESLDHDHQSSDAHDHYITPAAKGSSAIALEYGKEMEVEEKSSAGQDSLPVVSSAKDDSSSFNRAQNLVERDEPQGVAEPIIYESIGLDCNSEIQDIDPKREISPHVLKSQVCPLGLEQVVLKSDEGLESISFDDGKVDSPMSSTIEHKNDADVLEGNCSLVLSSELMEVDKYNLKEPFSFGFDAAEEENNKALDGKFEVDDSDCVSTAATSENLAECLEKDGVRETVNWMDTLHRGERYVQQDTDEPIMVTSVALDSAERAVCLDDVDTRELLDENAENLLQNDDLKCKDFANYREELDLRVDKRATFKSDEVADRNKSAATAASTITLIHNDFAGDASQQVSPEEFLGHYLVKKGCTVNDDDAPISISGHVCEIDPGQSEIVIDGKAISENIKGETSSCKTPLSSLRSSSSSVRGLQNSMKINSLADASNYKLSTLSELDLPSSQGNDTLEFNFVSKEIKGEEVAKSNPGESETYFHFGASQDKPTSIVMAAEDENSNQMEKESAKMNHTFSAVSKEPAWEDDTFSIEFPAASPHELVMAEAVVTDSSKDSALDEPVSDDKGVNKVDSSVQTNVEYVIPVAGLNTLGDTEIVGLNEGVPNQNSSMKNVSSAFINMPRNSDSTAEDAQILEPSTVDCERRKQGSRVEEHTHFSARKLNSSVMKGVKRDASYLIQSAPKRSVKMFDMKENAPSIKREHISNITADAATKRQALEELQTSPSMKREQASNIGAQPATKRQALENLQTTPNIKSEQTSHTMAKTARNRLAFEN